jgi:hypothetical protein
MTRGEGVSRGKKAVSLAFTGAATVAALGVPVGPVLAASGTWHIQASEGTPYHGAVTATATGAGVTAVDASRPSFPLTCTSAKTAGSVPRSTVTGTTASTTIGKIKTGTFAHCSFDGDILKAHLSKTANMQATTYNAKTGVTKIKITNVRGVLSGSGNSCHATVTGTVSASYHNTTHQLVIGKNKRATLTIHSPTAGCIVVGNGNKGYFTATYNVTTPKSLRVSGPA